MASPLVAALTGPDNIVRMVPCRVVSVSPVTIDFHDATIYKARKLAGATLVVGPALALVTTSAQPIVFQTGA